MNVIIIEDEPRTAKDLKGILSVLDNDIVVVAILSSVIAAVKWLNQHHAPDLIFSDIQLGDGLSFEIFKTVQVTAPVIFCTAYDQYAITAFESNGIDYLLKPIEDEMVERSLKKYKQMKTHLTGNNAYDISLNKVLTQLDYGYKQVILVHYREKIIPVKTTEISFLCVTAGTVLMHTITDQEYFVQYTIDQMESMLNPQSFFRVNRQFIISHGGIQNIERYFNRRLVVKMNCPTPEKIVVSRLRAQEFLAWVEK